MNDRTHDEAMAEVFRKDPAYAAELLASIRADGDAGELRIALRQMARAARERLAAGHPIYYREGDTPTGQVIKEYPDGHRELVKFDNGQERMISALAPWRGRWTP